MMLAATLGGMAFANSSVALVHGMSRPIGAVFHVPHGLSNAVLLPAVTRFSLSGAPERYATIARTMRLATAADSDAQAGEKLVAGLAEMNARLEVPRLRDCRGVDRERFDSLKVKMADDALASGSPGNNPVVPCATESSDFTKKRGKVVVVDVMGRVIYHWQCEWRISQRRSRSCTGRSIVRLDR